jgi:hypothetical protein
MNEDLEMLVEHTAKQFLYPPTPDLVAKRRIEQQRRFQRGTLDLRRTAGALAALLLVLAGLLAVPEIRAQVAAWLRIGAVEIVITTATPPARFAPGNTLPPSVLRFPGATTLEDARQHAGYPIELPAALGEPDRVFLVQAARPIVVLAWLDESGELDVSLHLLPLGTYSVKMTDAEVEEIEVNDEWAVWIAQPHWYLLRTGSGDDDEKSRQVMMHALIWEAEDGMTYRLETDRSLDEARRIAESIPVGNASSSGGVLEGEDQ